MSRSIYVSLMLLFAITAQAQTNMALMGHLPYSEDLNDIWGYTDGSGNEYALVGTVNGLSIVDLSDPANPQELHFVSGANSTWRDMKVWDNHAYVVNETSGGLQIVDLNNLPGTISTSTFTANDSLSSAHNIFIDENGYAYIFGFNNSIGNVITEERGAMILDLSSPKSPVVTGYYKGAYVHDGYVRDDMMYTSEIYDGNLSVIDVSAHTAGAILGQTPTPNRFTHNCWLSDDGLTVYTTDERSGAYVAAYDISDLQDIEELDRYQSSPGLGVIPHNTFVQGDHLVTSYYKDGVTIVDATRPNNLVQVGNYDTSPFVSADGFAGCWGVYPYFASGNIIASDSEEGLFVLSVNYTRACYLEGLVNSSQAGGAISGTRIEFIGTGNFKFSSANGTYRTGIGTPGDYDVRFYKPGCTTMIVTDVTMTSGQTTNLNVDLDCTTVGLGDDELADDMLQFKMVDRSKLYYYNNTGFTDPATIRLFTMNGQLYKEWQVNTPEAIIDLGTNTDNALYIADLSIGNEHRTLKIMLNH